MIPRAPLLRRINNINKPVWRFNSRRTLSEVTPYPRAVGAGEAKTSTPLKPPPTPWYKQPSFLRKITNVLLLSSFINTTIIISQYKSLLADIEWRSKERVKTLKETIARVREGKEIDIRAALGTGDPDMEKAWEDVLKEIEDEELHWKVKNQAQSEGEEERKELEK